MGRLLVHSRNLARLVSWLLLLMVLLLLLLVLARTPACCAVRPAHPVQHTSLLPLHPLDSCPHPPLSPQPLSLPASIPPASLLCSMQPTSALPPPHCCLRCAAGPPPSRPAWQRTCASGATTWPFWRARCMLRSWPGCGSSRCRRWRCCRHGGPGVAVSQRSACCGASRAGRAAGRSTQHPACRCHDSQLALMHLLSLCAAALGRWLGGAIRLLPGCPIADCVSAPCPPTGAGAVGAAGPRQPASHAGAAAAGAAEPS